jgi:hypothetical protein
MKNHCFRCNKTFSQKSNYDYHMRRIRPCKEIIIFNDQIIDTNITIPKQHIITQKSSIIPQKSSIIPQKSSIIHQLLPNINEELLCVICNKKYTRSDNLKRHLSSNKCKAKVLTTIVINENQQIKEENQQIKEENQQIKKKLFELENLIITAKTKNSKNSKKKITNTNTNTNTNSNNNIVINNIQIVNHGDEDIKKLNDTEVNKILNSRSKAMKNIAKLLHFNTRLPEYNNVYINNMRSKHAYVMKNGNFVVKDKRKTIQKMISNLAYDLNDLSTLKLNLSPILQKKLFDLHHWLITFTVEIETIDGKKTKADSEFIKKYNILFNILEMMLYNNRLMIKNRVLDDEVDDIDNIDDIDDIDNIDDNDNNDYLLETIL